MAIGAAVGLVGAQALESATGGADPAFAGAIGSVLGAALGRSGWMRVTTARARGRSVSLALIALGGRIVGCAFVGLGAVTLLGAPGAPVGGTGRALAIAGAAIGVALLVGTARLEHGWLRDGRDVTRGNGHGR